MYQDKAIPLVAVDQVTGKYNLTNEARDFIKSVPGPIGVVSVAGLYRTGKSYLLNRMILNRSNGFGVGPTVNPCTKGLWCWGTPIKGESPDGEKLNIIVIDTEGIGALDEDQTHDTRIFTLAILSSSCFIYNSTGSIDENAIENLSLVVNLTKHIQLGTDHKGEEEDLDKIANYFPSFFWVVRDFSLQIVDNEGNKMSPKQYLERALAPQKGFSDDIEDKNRIRKILTSFFKDRECITLVRPLIDETKLQDLEQLEFDELRPQFVSKVMEFRRTLTLKMKPKTLNNQKLNGQLYWSMLSSYVGAINDGAVPNIENAWHYMCQQQCIKLIGESYELFEKMTKDIRLPCDPQQIDREIEKAYQAAMDNFKRGSIGEQSQSYYRELILRMKERATRLRGVNAEEGKTAFKKYLNPLINPISQKLNKQQFESIEELIDQLKKLQEKVNKEGPKYVDWKYFLQISLKKMLEQSSMHLMRKAKNEREQIKKASEEKFKMNETQIDKLKKEKDTDYTSLMDQITTLEKAKVELKFRLQCMETQIQETNKQKSSEVQKLQRILNAKKVELEQRERMLEKKVDDANKRADEFDRTFLQRQIQWEKMKAVMEKQLEQSKQTIQDLERKKQNFETKYAVEKAEVSQKYSEQLLTEKQKVDELSWELSDKTEKNFDLEKRLLELTENHHEISVKYETNEKRYREEITQKNKEIEKLSNEKEFELSKIRDQYEHNQDHTVKVSRQLQDKLSKYEQKTRQLSEQIKTQRNKFRQQISLLQQQYSHLQVMYEENKAKTSELKQRYAEEIQAIQADHGMLKEQEIAKKILEIHNQHYTDIEGLKNDHEIQKSQITNQLGNLLKEKNTYQLELKLLNERFSAFKSAGDENQSKLNGNIQALENKVKLMERQHKTLLLQKQKQFKDMLAEKTRELDEEKQNHINSKQEDEAKLNTQITNLKNHFEMERQRQEQKYIEQRQKWRKQMRELKNQHENKLEQERQSADEERQMLESQLTNEIRALQLSLNELKHEKQRAVKQRNDFRSKFEATEQRMHKIENEMNLKYEKLAETAKAEKQAWGKRLEQLQLDKNKMQKQLLSLNHTKDQLANQTQKQQNEIFELQEELSRAKQNLQKQKQNYEIKIRDLTENFMKFKTNNQKEIALLEQDKRFLEEKNKELSLEKQHIVTRTDEQLKRLKENLDLQKKELTERLREDKKNYEQKIDKLKKANQEAESALAKKVYEHQRQFAVCTQKIQNLQYNLSESQSKRKQQVESLTQEVLKQKQERKNQKAQARQKVQELQQRLSKEESGFNEIKNGYEITIKLNESKISNLNDRLQMDRIQLGEKIQLLQKSLQDQRKKSENDKNYQQSTNQEIRAKLELKYRDDISKLKEELRDRNREIEAARKQYDNMLKELNEKLAFEIQSRGEIEKKVIKIEQQMAHKEKILTDENQAMRLEITKKDAEYQQQLIVEQNIYKAKLLEAEKRSKNLQNAKTQLSFEREKKQIQWNMERMNLEQRVQDLKEQQEKLNRDLSRLVKDNEKLKAQKKKNTSFIRNDRTFIYARDIPTENKENTPQQ